MNKPSQYIIVDLEATCWPERTRIEQMEIIEIGAVRLDGNHLAVMDEFQAFVKPREHPELSDFCRELTPIKQLDIDRARDFKTVFEDFLHWIGPRDYALCSWGAYDLKQFQVECRRHGLPLPTAFRHHINIKEAFCALRGLRSCGMKQALHLLGLPLKGTHHRGLDDARHIARIAQTFFSVLHR